MATLVCRECGVQGALSPLPSCMVDGKPLLSAPVLPRCGCFFRTSQGKLPASVAAMLAAAPVFPGMVDDTSRLHPSQRVAHDSSVKAKPESEAERRLTYSMGDLQSQQVMVYRNRLCDEALLGSVAITSEHKLSDVPQLLRDELKVQLPVNLYRGCVGEQLKVPLPQRQHRRLALPFFPSGKHHLLLEPQGAT